MVKKQLRIIVESVTPTTDDDADERRQSDPYASTLLYGRHKNGMYNSVKFYAMYNSRQYFYDIDMKGG